MNTTLRRTLFLATPFLASSLPHYAEARSTDPEVLELRRELAAMRQEMAAMRHDIRVQEPVITRASIPKTTAQHDTVATTPVWQVQAPRK